MKQRTGEEHVGRLRRPLSVRLGTDQSSRTLQFQGQGRSHQRGANGLSRVERVGTAPVRPQHSKPSPHRGGDSVQGLNEPLTEGYSGPAVKDTEKRALEGTNCSRNLTASQGKNSQIFKGIPKKKKKKKSSTQCKIHNVTHPVNITKDQTTGLPWCPVVRNPPSKARHVCAIPGPGTKIPHAGGN